MISDGDWRLAEERPGRGENCPTEEAKISCAEKHFEVLQMGDDFHYDVETRYHHLAR